jgi:hypothetical protein
MKNKILPKCFCWTRFGTEAGEAIGHIFVRKEEERIANRGVFIWGIGNALGPSIRELIDRTQDPKVLFSPIKSLAKLQDTSPATVAAWTSGETLDGDPFRLPKHSLVTSRYDVRMPKSGHYALVCYSEVPIVPADAEAKICLKSLRNIRTGRAIGASQVTAVVQQCEGASEETQLYDIAARADLVYPYFIRLRQPVVLPNSMNAHPAGQDWTGTAFQFVRQAAS